MAERPMGSGGVFCPPRMSALIAQAGNGVLRTFDGGQELRDLFQDTTRHFDHKLLNEFALWCFMGDLKAVKTCVETRKAPALTGTETPHKLGYAALVVLGGQRVKVRSGSEYKLFHSETLKFLLENGCPPDVEDIRRGTALTRATETFQDNADLARILVAHGADVNHTDIYGMIPTFGAVMCSYSKAVDVLMEGGADIDIPDADGTLIKNIYIFNGPKVTAVIHAWERRRAGQQALGEKGCAQCGKGGKLLFCAACHSIRYCSSECQRTDWKKHKQSCTRFSSSNTVTVRPRYPGPKYSTLIPTQQFARVVSGSSGPEISEREQRASHELTEYPKKMIIKVQVPSTRPSAAPMMVYDAKRELVCNLAREDAPAAYDRLEEVVRSRGTFGMKAYLAADVKSKDELVIKIDEVLAEQPF
ncbi:hypothetical protein BC826DRAFT_1022422 [Russula brevipes]|nr:hypothetical protein BC826DRAFT_1022422 [Russula brevipes]